MIRTARHVSLGAGYLTHTQPDGRLGSGALILALLVAFGTMPVVSADAQNPEETCSQAIVKLQRAIKQIVPAQVLEASDEVAEYCDATTWSSDSIHAESQAAAASIWEIAAPGEVQGEACEDVEVVIGIYVGPRVCGGGSGSVSAVGAHPDCGEIPEGSTCYAFLTSWWGKALLGRVRATVFDDHLANAQCTSPELTASVWGFCSESRTIIVLHADLPCNKIDVMAENLGIGGDVAVPTFETGPGCVTNMLT